MEAEYRPDYYKPVLIKYTDNESRLITSVAAMVSDGDKYFWDIIGTDITISDNDVHLWRKI